MTGRKRVNRQAEDEPDASSKAINLNSDACSKICIKRILGECLLLSSLPGKALRTLVDIARLAERFNMQSQSLAW